MTTSAKKLPLPQPQRLPALLEEAMAAEETVAIALVDIDLFGRFNEDHGAEAGDALLAVVAEILEDAASGSGQVLRYGGDAFVVVLAGVEKEHAFLRLEKARTAFVQRTEATISAGVAGAPDDATVAPLLIRKATDALYRAKVSGRNKVCLAREEKMVTKTTHYSQGQLLGLSRLSKRMGTSEAELLREALDDLFRKHNR